VPTLFVGLARDHNSPLLSGFEACFARWASHSHSRNMQSHQSRLKFENPSVWVDFSFASSCLLVWVWLYAHRSPPATFRCVLSSPATATQHGIKHVSHRGCSFWRPSEATTVSSLPNCPFRGHFATRVRIDSAETFFIREASTHHVAWSSLLKAVAALSRIGVPRLARWVTTKQRCGCGDAAFGSIAGEHTHKS
jgi:hypothetical protein